MKALELDTPLAPLGFSIPVSALELHIGDFLLNEKFFFILPTYMRKGLEELLRTHTALPVWRC